MLSAPLVSMCIDLQFLVYQMVHIWDVLLAGRALRT